MPKNRAISDRFWYDSYVSELSPERKLLFLYLLTNQLITLTGIYEIPMRNIAFDTGISSTDVKTYLQEFSNDGKIHYEAGHIILVNWAKYTSFNVGPVKQYAANQIKNLPKSIHDKYPEVIAGLKHLINPSASPTISPTLSPTSSAGIAQGDTYDNTKNNPTQSSDIPLPIPQPESPSTSTPTTTSTSSTTLPTRRYIMKDGRAVDTWEGKGKDEIKTEEGNGEGKVSGCKQRVRKGVIEEELAPGVWLSKEQQKELRSKYGDYGILEAPIAVSKYAEQEGIQIKMPYTMCLKFCDNHQKRNK